MTTLLQADRHLASEVPRYVHLKERILAEFPDVDAETLADTLEGLSDIREMIAAVVRSALQDEVMVDALKTRIADMRARLERLERTAERKRSLALAAMLEADVARLGAPDFTASLRSGSPTVEVVDEGEIDSRFWKPQPPKLDRQALLAALKAGGDVAGALLVPGKTQLSVRTK